VSAGLSDAFSLRYNAILPLVCTLWIGIGILGAAHASDDAQERLDTLRKAIELSRERLLEFDRNERGLLEALEATDKSIFLLGKEVARAQDAQRQADEALRLVTNEEKGIEALRASTQSAMSKRAVALYKAGDVGFLALLFSADDLMEFLERSRILRRLLENDRDLLARYKEQCLKLEDARTRHVVAHEKEAQASSTLRSRLTELEGQREKRRVALRGVRTDRRREREVLVELEAAAHALEEALKTMRDTPQHWKYESERRFADLKGMLAPPVDAKIIRGFGEEVDAEFRTKTFRKGVDFGARAGSAVRAVAEGEVRYAGWFRGYGKIVILDHADQYFTISGHLDSTAVDVGKVVKAGDVIGVAGETGSLSGPRLYFEIRHGSEALNPEPWFAR